MEENFIDSNVTRLHHEVGLWSCCLAQNVGVLMSCPLTLLVLNGCTVHDSGSKYVYRCISGWWFGTSFIFPYIGNGHPNWLIFFRGVQTTNQNIVFWVKTRRSNWHHRVAFISYERVTLYFTSVCILLSLCSRILRSFFRLEEESLTPQGEATTLARGSHSLRRLVPRQL